MPRLLFAQLLLLGLGLGPRGAAAMRSKAKGEPAQLHSSSAGLGGECPLAIEWQDKCYNLMGSPLQERSSNKCKDEKVKLANGKKYPCKVAYVCIPTHTKNPEMKAGNDGKMVAWKLGNCDHMSKTTTKKVCMAPPEEEWAEDVCALEPEIEKKEAQDRIEDQPLIGLIPEELIPEEDEDEADFLEKFECRCTSEAEVQAVWVSKSLVEHSFYEINKKLWAGGGIAELDSNSPCACNSGTSWFAEEGACSKQMKPVYAPTGGWTTGYFWGAWSDWQKKCIDTCAKADAKKVERFCEA